MRAVTLEENRKFLRLDIVQERLTPQIYILDKFYALENLKISLCVVKNETSIKFVYPHKRKPNLSFLTRKIDKRVAFLVLLEIMMDR